MDSSAGPTNRSSSGYDLSALPSYDISASDAMLSESESTLEQGFPSGLVDDAFLSAGNSGNVHPELRDTSTRRSKRSAVYSSLDVHDGQQSQGVSKKRKLTAGDNLWSNLPVETWQHIFLSLHPRDLGNLLKTARFFNKLLDPSSPGVPEASSNSKFLKPDTIWQLSRRSSCPRMPAPLKDMTELDMWRMCCSDTCQRCGMTKLNMQWQSDTDLCAGPGIDGIATVFAFGITCCGPCLLTEAEIDILLSSTIPSSLMPALPHVFVTNELHVISPNTLLTHSKGDIPQTTKLFWGPAIEKAKAELRLAQGLGSAAVEEWLKGLEAREKESRTDASRWEKWTASGGLAEMRKSLPSIPRASSDDHITTEAGSSAVTKSRILSQPDPPDDGQRKVSEDRPEKKREEAVALKALRRAEIERRAMLIDPPLPPNVLVHIASFQAAIRITAPVDDFSWELLKPRLLAQRTDAEQKENEKIVKVQMADTDFGSVRKVRKEVTDKDWDDIQGPVRARMAQYADEIIRTTWGKGHKVNKENSPKFAAEVLLTVRTRFYTDVAEDAATHLAAGRTPQVDPLEGPFTQKLTLENMKWVFDMKVKSHTEPYRKELFLCNGCDRNRYYGFEGVIQHYAAKHTRALSVGNVVVHWRAEWPEEPPFNPNPRGSKNTRHGLGLQQQLKPSALGRQDFRSCLQNGSVHPPPLSYPFALGAVPSPMYPPPLADSYGPPPAYHADGYNPPGPYHFPGYGVTGVPQPTSSANPDLDPYYPAMPENAPSTAVPPYSLPNRRNAFGLQDQAQPPYSVPLSVKYPRPYHAQLDELAQNAKNIWICLSSVKDLPGPLKVYVTIHQVLKRFRAKFFEMPSLRMFNDGLSNHKEMRPVRNINGLACRACTLGLGNALYVNPDRTSFSLPQLVNHFENRHLDAPFDESQSQLEWTEDMVLLPETYEMTAFQAGLGTRDHQFNLIYEVVPWAFNLTKPASNSQTHQPQAYRDMHVSSIGVLEKHQIAHTASPAGRDARQMSWSGSDYIPEAFAQHRYDHRRTVPLRYNGQLTASHHSYRKDDTVGHSDWGCFESPIEVKSRHLGDPGYYGTCSSTPADADYPVCERSQAPGVSFAGSRMEPNVGHSAEPGMSYRQIDRAGYSRHQAGARHDSMGPQERSMGRERTIADVSRSTMMRPDGIDDFSLTAALELHLAQERDGAPRARRFQTVNAGYHKVVKDSELEHDTITRGAHFYASEHPYNFRKPVRPGERYNYYPPAEGPQVRYYPDSHEVAADLQHETRYSYADEGCAFSLRHRQAYEDAYEIVHARDREEEFVIRRPVLRERDPSRVLYANELPAQPERVVYPPPRPHRVFESPIRDVKPVARPPTTRVQDPSSAALPRGKNEPSFFEEYDPRNTATIPPSGTTKNLTVER